jgi:hypothetical protein
VRVKLTEPWTHVDPRGISSETWTVRDWTGSQMDLGPSPNRPQPASVNRRTGLDHYGPVLRLEDFVNLAMMSTIKGTAFGEHFVAADQQMLTLRLAAGRWAAYGPAAK